MSVTGPGCAACSFTGTVPWASEPGMEGAFDVKPCDACGGFSWFRHRDEAVALVPDEFADDRVAAVVGGQQLGREAAEVGEGIDVPSS